MTVFKLKIIVRKGEYKGDFIYKDYPAANLDDAYAMARKYYTIDRYDIFLESSYGVIDSHKRDEYFEAIMSRSCPNCD
jgi:hypothetical protein